MFEFEDPSKYKAPDPCIPGVTDPVTRKKFPPKGDEAYWYQQYYNCLWGAELKEKQGDQQLASKLLRLKSYYDIYFLRKGYSGAELFVQDERRRRKRLLPPQEFSSSGQGANPVTSVQGAPAQLEAPSSRTRSKLPLPGRSPRVVQEAIERTQSKRTNFKFLIKSENEFDVVLPKNFNCGLPLTEDDFQFIFRRFQRAVTAELDVEIEDDHYPHFVQKLKEFIEREHDRQLKVVTVSSNPVVQKPQESDRRSSPIKPPESQQEGSQQAKLDDTSKQGDSEVSLISFAEEFHSFNETFSSQEPIDLEDHLRKQEARVQQDIKDSGFGSVITEHYYSYVTGSDSEPVTSADEVGAEETESESEEQGHQTTSGNPGDPDNPNSSSSDEQEGSDNSPPQRSGSPHRNTEFTDQGQGGSSGQDQRTPDGQGQQQGSDPPPPPNPTNLTGSTAKSQGQAADMSDEKANHYATSEALTLRLSNIRDEIEEHENGTTKLTSTEAEVHLEDLKTMGTEISELGKGCYRFFKDEPGKTEQTSAVGSFGNLQKMYFEIRTKMTDIFKSFNTNVTGSRLKTPKVSVPKFSGNHKDWPMFKSEFTNLVANVNLYSSSEKLRLLIEALSEGDAKDNITDLQINDGNWTIAWDRIKNRYDSPRETAHAAIRPLLELPPLMSQSENGLHKLISTVRTTRAQLEQVEKGTVSEAEILYVHFIMGRLDTKTINEFNASQKTNAIPSLNDCIAFLEKKAKNVGLTKEIKNNAASAAPAKTGQGKKDHHVKKVMVAFSDSEAGFSSDTSSKQVKTKKKKSNEQVQKRNKSPNRGSRGTVAAVKGRNSWPRERSKSRDGAKARRPNNGFVPPPCGYCGNVTHRVSACKDYEGLSVSQRREWVRNSGRCFNCLGQHKVSDCTSKFSCASCKQRHHSSLHQDGNQASSSKTAVHTVLQQFAVKGEETGLLPTAVVLVENKHKSLEARALVDTGAQNSFITSNFVRRLGLPVSTGHDKFSVAGGKNLPVEGKTSFTMRSMVNPSKTFTVEAHILKEITSELPNSKVDIQGWRHLENLPLADPGFNIPGKIDLLLGIPVVDRIMRNRRIRGRQGIPGAYSTELGFLIMGPVVKPSKTSRTCLAIFPTEEVQFNMEKFWNVEEPPMQKHVTLQEKLCEEHFKKHTIRRPDGRYQVRLPFKPDSKPLGDSFDMAVKRWLAVERKLTRTPEMLAEYNRQLQDYLDKKQMEEVPQEDVDKAPNYYMPHHAVIKESSTTTRVRVVFDASARTTTGVSLNDNLMPGTTVQPKLCDHLLRFRARLIALLADIGTMYREMGVHPDDCEFLRIVWRRAQKDPIRAYRLLVLAFGLTSSPWLATRCLNQVAEDEGINFPMAEDILKNAFYVDDLMTSLDSEEEAKELTKQLIGMLEKAHMKLRKWSSNSEAVLANLAPDQRETKIPLSIDETATIKTLGLQWNPATDLFQFKLNFDLNRTHTKRSMLSDISKIYDPLGWLSPTTVKSKIIMQAIWMRELQWDDSLPEDIENLWREFASNLPKLELIRIPRFLGFNIKFAWELHGFCDASEKAYSAAIYLRGLYEDKVICNLVMAKTRVAPIKIMALPRLELQGAVLVAQLLAHVHDTMGIPISERHLWTDSMIVLHWINSFPHKWKIFVANRIQQIHDVSEPEQWHHVRSEDNPADCASRGIGPDELPDHPIWWKGPSWLSDVVYPIPEWKPTIEPTGEEKTSLLAMQVSQQPITLLDQLEKFSSWTRIIRVVTILGRIQSRKTFRINWKEPPTPGELGKAEDLLILLIQERHYGKLDISKDRTLRTLNPFYDQQQILRVGGRLRNANLPFNMKHPIIIPGQSPIIRTMILHFHNTFAHAGQRTILNHLRQKYWIIGGAKAVKSVIHKCILCFRFRAQPTTQLMGPLPEARVNAVRPFLKVGVDFAGPYEIRNFSGNRATKVKVWICLFTCFTSRAIHLELVSSLSYEGFLLALRRFMARRGRPSDIYSDNGTNFVGANNFMTSTAESLQALQTASDGILPGLALSAIRWHFNPPRAPHSGGVWEVCVKLVKEYLKKILSPDSAYSWEEFDTILVFTEALVNSRPLTPMSNDPDDLDALTPAHFLIGHSLLWVPEHDLSHIKSNRLDKFQLIQRRSADMWERWRQEYLHHLQQRQKWREKTDNLKPGDMVLVLGDQAPPMQWKLGRIKATHPGADGLVRVTTVETGGKEFVRPITKLAKLPLDEEESDEFFDEDEEIKQDLNLIPDTPRNEDQSDDDDEPVPALTIRHDTTPFKWITAFLALCTVVQISDAITVPSEIKVSNFTESNDGETSTNCGFNYTVGKRFNWQRIQSYELTTVALVLTIIGCFLNMLTIAALLFASRLRGQTATWLVINLSAANVIFSITGLPMQAWKHYSPEWMLISSWCRAFPFIYYGNMACTLFAITAITINRLVRIVYSHYYDRIYTRKLTALMILLTWMVGYGLMLIPLLEIWGRLGLRRGKIPSCTWIKDKAGRNPKEFLVITGILMPILTIIGCYSAIYRHVKRSRANLNNYNEGVITPNTRSDRRLAFSVACIFVGYLVCFLPVTILHIFDPKRKLFCFSSHTAVSVLAWTHGCVNQLIYAFTNTLYRHALKNLVWPSFMKRTFTQVNLHTITAVIVALLFMIGGARGMEFSNTSLAVIAPSCQIPWNAHHEIPICTQRVRWVHVQADGTLCSREISCKRTQAVSADARSCKIVTEQECPVMNNFQDLDQLRCQQITSQQGSKLLERPGVKTELCAVGDYTLKPCRHFVEEVRDVAVVINEGKVYPVVALNLRAEPRLQELSSYTCTGDCNKVQCSLGDCLGDEVFCRNFKCLREDVDLQVNNIMRSGGVAINSVESNDEHHHQSQKDEPPKMFCTCKYNASLTLHKIITPEGEVIPQCYGHLYVPVRKEDLSKTNEVYGCHDCVVECTRTGIQVTTPGKVARYIKAQRNPGFVSTVPDAQRTDIFMTNHMLASTGKIHVEIWFTDFDSPSIMELKCPRIPVCELITCYFCLARWGNVSCYTVYHWLLILALGVIISTIIVIVMYVTRVMMIASWWFCWPFRTCVRLVKQQTRRKTYYKVPYADPEGEDISLRNLSSNPYMRTTVNLQAETSRIAERRMKGSRKPSPTTMILGLLCIFVCLSICDACSNFAAMSAANRECHTTSDNQVLCSVRINTRLALSLLGQSSCFRIEDAHKKLLGTITIETKSVDLMCMKQLLYYVPRPVANCLSAFLCYDIYSSAECHGWKCRDFGVNDSISAFKDSQKNLGWSYCLALRHPHCPWILTRDCNFFRTWLSNPTNEAYAVYNCPEWTTSVHLELTLHMGDRIVRNRTRLQAGTAQLVDGIEFSLISVSTPRVPILNECIIRKGGQAALAPCNSREEISLNKLGEIQCNSLQEAKSVTQGCMASPNIIRPLPDLDGVKCLSDVIDPEKLMNLRPLPLKLEDGMLVPHEEDIIFESSTNTLLEVQISTENYVLTKTVQESTCTANFVQLVGCYGCLGGATMILEAKVDHGEELASLECPEAGFFIPLHLTAQDSKHAITVKLDIPDVDMKCEIKCSLNKIEIHVQGHLQYISNADVRDTHMAVSYEPLDTGSGFSLVSLSGLGWYNWLKRGIIISVVLVFVVITLYISFNIAIRKLL